jgi:hypothetical protein
MFQAGGRIKVWTDKQAWLSPNPASVMIHKVRAAILGKVEEGALDVDTPTAAVYLKSQWPWDLLWQSFENVTNKARIQALTFSMGAMKGHTSRARAEAIGSSQWHRGLPFISPQARSRAKQAVMIVLANSCRVSSVFYCI